MTRSGVKTLTSVPVTTINIGERRLSVRDKRNRNRLWNRNGVLYWFWTFTLKVYDDTLTFSPCWWSTLSNCQRIHQICGVDILYTHKSKLSLFVYRYVSERVSTSIDEKPLSIFDNLYKSIGNWSIGRFLVYR